MPPPETPLEYLATFAGTVAGVMSDVVVWAIIICMVAAGHRQRSAWVPAIFAITLQAIISLINRPLYLQTYPSYAAYTNLLQDAEAPFTIRLAAFYAAWGVGQWWAGRHAPNG